MFVGHMGYFIAFANIYKVFAVLIIEVFLLIELTQPNFEDGNNETKWRLSPIRFELLFFVLQTNSCKSMMFSGG